MGAATLAVVLHKLIKEKEDVILVLACAIAAHCLLIGKVWSSSAKQRRRMCYL